MYEGIIYYLKLKFKILNRQMSDFGISPFFGYILIGGAFFLFSNNLLDNFKYTEYLFMFIALTSLGKLNERKKIEFLKKQFKGKEVFGIRIFENTMMLLPFLSLLFYNGDYELAMILLILGLCFALTSFRYNLNYAFRTPYAKYPFEFLIGFRRYFLLFLFSYWLVYISISSSNLNIGIFGIILVIFTCCLFYSTPERIFYVWIFSMNPTVFLKHKISVAVKYSFCTSFPITAILSFFFFDEIFLIIGFQFLGLVYLVTIILGKYAAYPSKLNLPQTLGIFLSIWLPPLLFLLIPFFYKESIRRINIILK